jgi:hypothetical protein
LLAHVIPFTPWIKLAATSICHFCSASRLCEERRFAAFSAVEADIPDLIEQTNPDLAERELSIQRRKEALAAGALTDQHRHHWLVEMFDDAANAVPRTRPLNVFAALFLIPLGFAFGLLVTAVFGEPCLKSFQPKVSPSMFDVLNLAMYCGSLLTMMLLTWLVLLQIKRLRCVPAVVALSRAVASLAPKHEELSDAAMQARTRGNRLCRKLGVRYLTKRLVQLSS